MRGLGYGVGVGNISRHWELDWSEELGIGAGVEIQVGLLEVAVMVAHHQEGHKVLGEEALRVVEEDLPLERFAQQVLQARLHRDARQVGQLEPPGGVAGLGGVSGRRVPFAGGAGEDTRRGNGCGNGRGRGDRGGVGRALTDERPIYGEQWPLGAVPELVGRDPVPGGGCWVGVRVRGRFRGGGLGIRNCQKGLGVSGGLGLYPNWSAGIQHLVGDVG